MPSISICLSWWPRSSRRDWKCCCGQSVFHHILVVNLINIEDGLEGGFSLNPEVDVVPSISCRPELLVGHDVGVETRDVGNILGQEELLACWRIDINLDVPIAFHIGTAISS